MNMGYLAALAAFGASAFAAAQIPFGPADLLNGNGAADLRGDFTPDIAAGLNGRMIAVWESHENIGGIIGFEPDILYAISDDSGASWTLPALMNLDGFTDTTVEAAPRIATDGAGVWVAVWGSTENLTGIGGANWDIKFARSIDNGATWSLPALVHANGATDTGNDQFPAIATDGDGVWAVVWESREDITGGTSFDRDIFLARSTDGGVVWAAPILVNSEGTTDTGQDQKPVIAADGSGTWIVAWESIETPETPTNVDFEIVYSRSADDGLTWSPQARLNSNGAADFQNDQEVSLATDGAVWIAVWYSNDHFGQTIGQDRDILSARSLDGGLTWQPVVVVNATAFTDSGIDDMPHVATDGLGNWIAVWRSNENIGGNAGTDHDIFAARSTDGGASWSAPMLVNSYGNDALSLDLNPVAVADGAGNWIIAWEAAETVVGVDNDIWRTTFTLGAPYGDLMGLVVDAATLEPINDAAVVASAGGVEFAAATDENGRYRLPDLPEGVYAVTAYGVQRTPVTAPALLVGGALSTRNFRLDFLPEEGQIFGTVVDSVDLGGIAVARVGAWVDGEVAGVSYSAVQGNFTFTTSALEKAVFEVELIASADGYVESFESVNADTEAAVGAVIELVPALGEPIEVRGVVTTLGTGEPIDGATVVFYGPVNRGASTGRDGDYVFFLPPGTYRAEASDPNHTGVQTVVVVDESGAWSPALPAGAPGVDLRDANFDGVINAVDIQNIVNAALGLPGTLDCDVNGDGSVDAIDVQLVINGALGLQ